MVDLEVGQVVEYVVASELSYGQRKALRRATRLNVPAIVTGFDDDGAPNLDLVIDGAQGAATAISVDHKAIVKPVDDGKDREESADAVVAATEELK